MEYKSLNLPVNILGASIDRIKLFGSYLHVLGMSNMSVFVLLSD